MSYKHLSLEERHYIEFSFRNDNSLTQIANDLGRPRCTISREIKRNTGLRGYRHNQANRMAQQRHTEKPKAVKLTADIKAVIGTYIRQEWSPEQIAGRLKKEGIVELHHETIYQYILSDKVSGGDLHTHLRHQNKTYRKRYGSVHNRSQNGIPNRTDISERPEEVNQRERVGDWEGDTIIGKNHKGAIVTLDERKSKIRLAMPVSSKKARGVTDAVISLFKPIVMGTGIGNCTAGSRTGLVQQTDSYRGFARYIILFVRFCFLYHCSSFTYFQNPQFIIRKPIFYTSFPKPHRRLEWWFIR